MSAEWNLALLLPLLRRRCDSQHTNDVFELRRVRNEWDTATRATMRNGRATPLAGRCASQHFRASQSALEAATIAHTLYSVGEAMLSADRDEMSPRSACARAVRCGLRSIATLPCSGDRAQRGEKV